MEAMFKIPIQEFNLDLFKNLQEILGRLKTGEVTIAIRNDGPKTETPEEYEKRLLGSIKELEEGKGIVFTMSELEDYIKDLVKE